MTFTAKAVGDVGCTGKVTTFTISGKTGPDGPVIDTSDIMK